MCIFPHADLICAGASSGMLRVAHRERFAHNAMHLGTHRGAQLAKVSRSTRQKQVREAQARWLDTVVRQTGLSLTEIARRGDLNPSTLTRFRNNDVRGGTLAVRTLSTIAEVTKIGVPADIVGDPPAGTGFREPEAETYTADRVSELGRMVRAALGDQLTAHAWLLRSRALEYAGYRPGDILIVDETASPLAGDVVCAQIYDLQRGGAETVFRIYQPPVLIGAGPEEAAMRPRFVDDEVVAIRGVVLTSLRGRAGRG